MIAIMDNSTDSAEEPNGVIWALLEDEIWWPVLMLGATVVGSHPLWSMTDPNGPTVYQFGTHATQAHVMTRQWRGVEHSKCLHGQPVLAASTDEVLNIFAVAVAEAKEFCIAFTHASAPPPSSKPTTMPVLVESKSVGDATPPAVEPDMADIAWHEMVLQHYWDCFLSSPSNESVAAFSSRLDGTIATLIAVVIFVSKNPLGKFPSTTMQTIHRTLVMSVIVGEWTCHDVEVMARLPDKSVVDGCFRVLMWSLQSVITPRLEPQAAKQWVHLIKTIPDGILASTRTTLDLAKHFFMSNFLCGKVVELSMGKRTKHMQTLRLFKRLYETYEDSLHRIHLVWPILLPREESRTVAAASSWDDVAPPAAGSHDGTNDSMRTPERDPSMDIITPPTPPPTSECTVSHSTMGSLGQSSQSATTSAWPRSPKLQSQWSVDDVASRATTSTPMKRARDDTTNTTEEQQRWNPKIRRPTPTAEEYTVDFTAGQLGLVLQTRPSGVLVGTVLPNSQASRAAVIKKGDVLIKIRGIAIKSKIEIVERFVGSTVRPLRITFRRELAE
ncbi:hypothetical protein AaE_007930 [Aphanomyces astaci]|uniref:PDZ domain-containing protein n=1 Tax=Aphanomyces astaci TaxID=112090 RepID=A0A6A5A1C0_APHAT|nr:hypothetical protein AaE_007930 [Aphanomyces astaci]